MHEVVLRYLPQARRLLLEPFVVGLAFAGVTALCLLPVIKPEQMAELARACRIAGLQGALTLSFVRAVLVPAMAELARMARGDEGRADDDGKQD